MTRQPLRQILRAALITASALSAVPAIAQTAPAPVAAPAAVDDLAISFRDPPASARPRVWWHWMNGNITQDGIAKDLAWLKSVGVGGVQNFDVNLMTPKIVDHRLAYMTPEWKAAFRFAASEADRLGLELAIAASPGWSETGGPWVKPEDGLKKLVWSQTRVAAGKRFKGVLPPPPSATGPYLTLEPQAGIDDALADGHHAAKPHHYGDVAVLAVPDFGVADVAPAFSAGDGAAHDWTKLGDADLNSGIALKRGPAEAPSSVVMTYATPQTIRSASVFIAKAVVMFSGASVRPELQSSADGQSWTKVIDLPVAGVPTTVSFAPVTARYFRVVLHPLVGGMSNMMAPAPGAVAPDLFAMMTGGAGAPWDLRHLSLSASPAIDRFETKAGFALTMDYYALGQVADGAKGIDPAKVIDITSQMRPDGSIDWAAPKLPKGGQWRIIRMGHSLLGTTNHPAPAEATGLEVDKFDGDAVRRYMDHYLGMYRDATGPDLMGKRGLRAILTDSIEVGAANWTPKMIAQFKTLRGYDPTPFLPALMGVLVGDRAASDRFLFDWRRTLGDLMASEHYGTVARAAHDNGLIVYGEALEDKRPSLGDDMAMRSHADVPMAAMWTFPQGMPANPSYVADIKGAASVAHIYGQNLVAAESMTSALTYWADSPRTLKHIIDLEFVLGVNRPVFHTSVHQPVDDKVPGLSLMIFGQFFNRHEAWAPLAKAWVDYIARNGLMLQQGRHYADVGYFYGEEAPLTGLYGLKLIADAPKTRAYDFVNTAALADALRNDGAELVAKGGARYKALYLGGSSHQMSLNTLRRIAELAQGGATIIGVAPTGSPSLQGGQTSAEAAEYAALIARLWPNGATTTAVGKGRVIASTQVEAALDQMGVGADFRMSGGAADADVPFLHRELADGHSYFLVNRQQREERFEAHFRVTGKVPELWHAETGTSEPVSYRIENGETIVAMTLNAGESVHVVFRKPATADSLMVKKLAPATIATVDGAWTVAFQPGRGAPASAVLPALKPLNEHAEAGIKYFSGLATYSREVSAPKGYKAGAPLWLDLGRVGEMAQVLVNGVSVGTVWHAPYRVDVSRAMRPGKNRIEVQVANLWVNRLIGDAQPDMQKPGAQKITFTAMPTYKPDAPLVPAGLIGPVTFMGAAAGK
ncbi:glycoside hydrolase [Novosphingobium sp. FSY-8]|uniref:Glycoside hydrolase n=1 Tax=Novosphingobium ovatum TaxID=1908523 RepID=A0ABW9XD94_9SPHN|nr:glycosyl hydrolase [Novosphingobium ovatum]NBC36503.1 glycoside hydrolase [Novosphingobium ovatum]